MRAQLLRVLKGLPERYEEGSRFVKGLSQEEFSRTFNGLLWRTFRNAWDALVSSRSCEAFGVTLIWSDGELRRL